MIIARICNNCINHTPDKSCPKCGHDTIRPDDIHLGKDLRVDVTISLRLDHRNRPFLLIQKPSGQDSVGLQAHDILPPPSPATQAGEGFTRRRRPL